ncbi:MAG: BON domain-containing protein [Azonexaceae bacterium]|nr:BON domain-containing protein [Azonexaceae bacterium]
MIERHFKRFLLFALATLAGLGLGSALSGQVRALDLTDAVLAHRTDQLVERIEEALHHDAALAGSHFVVALDGQVVLLRGSVPDERTLHRALGRAAAVPGVGEVRNHLEIDPRAWGSDAS